MNVKHVAAFAVVGLLSVAPASAKVQILRHDPGKGQLPAGQTVLVDDGSCPKGQIKEVKGGSDRSLRTGSNHSGSARTHRCIARP